MTTVSSLPSGLTEQTSVTPLSHLMQKMRPLGNQATESVRSSPRGITSLKSLPSLFITTRWWYAQYPSCGATIVSASRVPSRDQAGADRDQARADAVSGDVSVLTACRSLPSASITMRSEPAR